MVLSYPGWGGGTSCRTTWYAAGLLIGLVDVARYGKQRKGKWLWGSSGNGDALRRRLSNWSVKSSILIQDCQIVSCSVEKIYYIGKVAGQLLRRHNHILFLLISVISKREI